VFVGNAAGAHETGSNSLYIDNAPRASEADAKVKALVYGVFDAAVANQSLAVNGTLNASSYKVGGVAGASGTFSSVTVVGGIVTAGTP
jgi:hypothetical protein